MSEPMVQLIHLTRQLQGFDDDTLIDWIQRSTKLFGEKENGAALLSEILLTGITKHFKKIPTNLFNQLIEIKRNDDIIINDTISFYQNTQTVAKSIDNDVSHLSILSMNEDTAMYTCRFLAISDLLSLSQTCRYLCTIALRPVSISNVIIFCYNQGCTKQFQIGTFPTEIILSECCLFY